MGLDQYDVWDGSRYSNIRMYCTVHSSALVMALFCTTVPLYIHDGDMLIMYMDCTHLCFYSSFRCFVPFAHYTLQLVT